MPTLTLYTTNDNACIWEKAHKVSGDNGVSLSEYAAAAVNLTNRMSSLEVRRMLSIAIAEQEARERWEHTT